MTTDEILAKATAHIGKLVDELSVVDGRVYLYATFDCDEDQETHDVAWDKQRDLQDWLNEIGLQIVDNWYDNDSLGGYVEEVKP